MHSVASGGVALVDPHLQRALDAIDHATRGLTEEAWLRAAPGQWNSAQILEHLGKAYGSTAYILDKCIADGGPKGRQPSWRQRVYTTLIVELGYFPTGVAAPEITRPDGLLGTVALAYARRRCRRSTPRPRGATPGSAHAPCWPITPSSAASLCANGDDSTGATHAITCGRSRSGAADSAWRHRRRRPQ